MKNALKIVRQQDKTSYSVLAQNFDLFSLQYRGMRVGLISGVPPQEAIMQIKPLKVSPRKILIEAWHAASSTTLMILASTHITKTNRYPP